MDLKHLNPNLTNTSLQSDYFESWMLRKTAPLRQPDESPPAWGLSSQPRISSASPACAPAFIHRSLAPKGVKFFLREIRETNVYM